MNYRIDPVTFTLCPSGRAWEVVNLSNNARVPFLTIELCMRYIRRQRDSKRV
jgi:hypothetical protein